MNWGNKLLVAFIVFGLGMGYLAYRSMNTNFELVENDYYKQDGRWNRITVTRRNEKQNYFW